MDIETAKKLANYDARLVAFGGTMNCRDLGGLSLTGGGSTVFGRLYRSGRLSNLSEDDHPVFSALNFRHIVDFRLPFERDNYPNVLPEACLAREHQLGYLPAGALEMFDAINRNEISPDDVWRGMREQYEAMAMAHPEIHRTLVREILAEDSTPSLFHCSGGKDRTGVAAALLLSLAGVRREVVIADYLLTNLDTPKLGVIADGVDPALLAIVGSAHEVLIEAALDAVEKQYATFADYYRGIVGLDAAEVEALRAILVES